MHEFVEPALKIAVICLEGLSKTTKQLSGERTSRPMFEPLTVVRSERLEIKPESIESDAVETVYEEVVLLFFLRNAFP
jgi:hypothetical protein